MRSMYCRLAFFTPRGTGNGGAVFPLGTWRLTSATATKSPPECGLSSPFPSDTQNTLRRETEHGGNTGDETKKGTCKF